jgi:predicted short-subunit dehydrogenase-like oxidoreductase (DUF2520 family)
VKSNQNIVILGSGNVATQLSLAFKQKNINILQIYSRSIDHAKELASKLGCGFTNNINQIDPSAELYLIALSDSAVEPVLKQANWTNKILVHTAGSVESEILKHYTNNYGVFYPYQTFTKDKNIDLSQTHFFIEGSNDEVLDTLLWLGSLLSNKVKLANSQQREILHLAGIFVNNFTNHMASIAFDILNNNNINADAIYPLLKETIEKAAQISPQRAQTGPARRNNIEVIEKHVQLLQQNPEWQKIYTFVSESINKYYNG